MNGHAGEKEHKKKQNVNVDGRIVSDFNFHLYGY